MAKKVIDHKGNEFKSVSEMCRYWGVSSKLFYSRHRHCRDLEYCLSPKKGKGWSSCWCSCRRPFR